MSLAPVWIDNPGRQQLTRDRHHRVSTQSQGYSVQTLLARLIKRTFPFRLSAFSVRRMPQRIVLDHPAKSCQAPLRADNIGSGFARQTPAPSQQRLDGAERPPSQHAGYSPNLLCESALLHLCIHAPALGRLFHPKALPTLFKIGMQNTIQIHCHPGTPMHGRTALRCIASPSSSGTPRKNPHIHMLQVSTNRTHEQSKRFFPLPVQAQEGYSFSHPPRLTSISSRKDMSTWKSCWGKSFNFRIMPGAFSRASHNVTRNSAAS